MSSPWYHRKSPEGNNGCTSPPVQNLDDAEKGLQDHTDRLPIIPPPRLTTREEKEGKIAVLHIETSLKPTSPVHEGITPFSSVPELSLSWPHGFKSLDAAIPPQKPAPAKKKKPKVSRWILFQLWFNTYRKFFTFVVSFNITGIVLAALGRFPYAEDHMGALVLGNLLCAILMRNELFLRFLYIIAIYGLRSVRSPGIDGTTMRWDTN